MPMRAAFVMFAPAHLLMLALAFLLPAFCFAQNGVWKDPPDSLRPAASMDEISISSHGDRMNGLIYEAAGSGPHPVVIFLHGRNIT